MPRFGMCNRTLRRLGSGMKIWKYKPLILNTMNASPSFHRAISTDDPGLLSDSVDVAGRRNAADGLGLAGGSEAAIAPAAITVGAQKKERAAFTARQKLWSQNRFAMNRHACSPAGAGQGSRRSRACVRLHTEVVSRTIRVRNSALRQSVATVPTFLA